MNRGLKYSQKRNATDRVWLHKSSFKKFTPAIFGVDQILAGGETFDALAVILDLEDFTTFCDQRDPHLVIPHFIKAFLDWLFQKLKAELLIREDGSDVILWSHLPFFGKFLGDGVLLLWDVTYMSHEFKQNIVYSFDLICQNYRTRFLSSVRKVISKPPPRLRCGIAQGQITSIAEGSDFVGICINIASRLQKLGDGAFTFAFTQKGLEPDDQDEWSDNFRLIRIPVRGVSNEELVYVLKSEFQKLSKEVKRAYQP